MGLILALFLLLASPAYADNIIGEGPVYAREQGKNQRFYYVSGGNGDGQVEYICEGAHAGVTGTALSWRIRKLVYDSSNRVSTIEWADGTDNYTKACDSRTGYDYTPDS